MEVFFLNSGYSCIFCVDKDFPLVFNYYKNVNTVPGWNNPNKIILCFCRTKCVTSLDEKDKLLKKQTRK